MSDIVNPYIVGNPVTGSEMFFDRKDVFECIHRTLIGKHRDNVIILYGQQRTGKTSVLYQMRSRFDERYLCIFIDLHGFELEGLHGFLWELTNHIIRVLRLSYHIDLPRPDHSEFFADPRGFFETVFLNQVWSAIGDKHLLLMLDEFAHLEEQVQAGKLEHEIFKYLRHLMQHYERLDFLFSLGIGLEEMKEYAFLFNVALYKKISFLDRKNTSNLITEPIKDYYQVEPAAVERIYHITSGHPYYTQLVCHCLFDYWQQQSISPIGVQDVDEVLNEAVERGSAVLMYVWEASTPGEKAVLTGMVAAMEQNNQPIGTDDINRAWACYDVVIPKGEMIKAIKSLIARDVIVGQDKYIFTVDLQRLWVQKHERLEWVKEEIASAIRDWLSTVTTGKQGLYDAPLRVPPLSPPRRFSAWLTALLYIMILGSLGFLLYSSRQTSIITGILFWFIFLSVFTIVSSSLFIVKRRRLFSFFGISHNIPNIFLYVTRISIRASEGAGSVTRGFIGPVTPVSEYYSAEEIRNLFRSNLVALMPKALNETFRKISIIFADIDPPVNTSPEVMEFDSNMSKYLSTNLILIGSGIYNAASRHYLEQPTSPFYFSQKEITNAEGQSGTERVLIERKTLRHGVKDIEIPGRSLSRELAIIQRIKDYDHGGITVFLCAGLGSSATRGSVHYLVRYWQNLQRAYGPHDFAICLEFEGQQDDSEEVIKPTCTHQKWRKYDPLGRSATWMDGIPQTKEHRSNNLT